MTFLIGDAEVLRFLHAHGMMLLLFSDALPRGLVLLRLAPLDGLLGVRGVSIGACHGVHLRLFGSSPPPWRLKKTKICQS